MPVATYGAVRGVAAEELEALGAQILLANTYHLHERPGEAVVERLGGLHGFTSWRGPWLTDSGGYQVTSLVDRVRVDEAGVSFASPRDGRRRELTPEGAVRIQETLGSDIAMVLDECRPLAWLRGNGANDGGDGEARLRGQAAADRTLRWAERGRRAHRRADQALFGIVQGGAFPDLRRASARATASLGFAGYAHGGLGLGETRAARAELVAVANAELPEEAPRYLMGIGPPADLLDAIAAGVDLFDCVIPTRHARHGVVFTREGPVHLRTLRFRDDSEPIEPGCDCPACRRYSRAYLRHLLREREMLGGRLASLHNLRFTLRLLEQARRAIAEGRFSSWRREQEDALAS